MRTLAFLVALAVGPGHIHLRPTHAIEVYGEPTSCGALPRLLHDRWDVQLRDGFAFVNLTRWEIVWSTSFGTILQHVNTGAFTEMSMMIEVYDDGHLSGTLTLRGRTESRRECSDTVALRG